jgi:S1-C subfamily serine protease
VRLEERQEGQSRPAPPPVDPREFRSRPDAGEKEKPSARPGLGISVETLNPTIASARGFEGLRGAYVIRVEAGSAAANEIFADDLIVEVNYRSVASREEYQRIIAGLKSGDDVVIRVLRKWRGPLRSYLIVSLTVP